MSYKIVIIEESDQITNALVDSIKGFCNKDLDFKVIKDLNTAKHFNYENVNLVFIDFCFSELNGIGMAKWIESSLPDPTYTKIIIITQYLEPFSDDHYSEDCFLTHLLWPIDNYELKKLVDEVIL